MRQAIERSRVGALERDAETNAVLTFRFAPDEPIFQGHFPGRPILPGVFQIEMARMAAEWATGRRLAIREIDKAKFVRPVLPGETIRLALRLEAREEGLIASASLSIGGEPAGEARLKLVHEDAGDGP
jgi:3-hydroxyacyl-[acyl-carrier-protein] dehydratase